MAGPFGLLQLWTRRLSRLLAYAGLAAASLTYVIGMWPLADKAEDGRKPAMP
jgi:hypothetical protein